MEYSDCINDLCLKRSNLAHQIARFTNLEHILSWLTAQSYPLGSLDMITQDEFSHDLLILLGDDWLAFGMT